MPKHDFEFDNFYYYMKEKNHTNTLEYYDNKIKASQYKVPMEVTAKHLGSVENVLDWSCGDGHFSTYLCYKSIHTVGTSFYNKIPEFLNKNPYFNFILVDEKENVKLPFDDNTFDIVFSIGVLEHVHETGGSQELSLKEINRILKDNGKFICFHLPNKYSWVENLGKIIPRKIKSKLPIGSPHSKTFSRKDVQMLLAKTDFTLLDYGFYSFLPKNFTYALPRNIVQNDIFISLFLGIDRLFAFLLPFMCAQSYFIASKSKD